MVIEDINFDNIDDNYHSSYSDAGKSILYLLFDRYKKYNITSYLDDPSKLIIIPDFYESNITKLSDYFKYENITNDLTSNLPEKLKKSEKGESNNVFFKGIVKK